MCVCVYVDFFSTCNLKNFCLFFFDALKIVTFPTYSGFFKCAEFNCDLKKMITGKYFRF